MGAEIIIIEDEREIRRLLEITLSGNGYGVHQAQTAKEGELLLATKHPDLIILDLGLPDRDGQELIRAIREWSEVPIIVLSARDQETQKIEALENGADDYLTKPFSAGELLARIKVALRHSANSQASADPTIEQNGLLIDLAARRIKVDDCDVHLTPIEYKLMTALARHAGKVITHGQLIKEIWGRRAPDNNQGLRIHMQHLREKLGDDPLKPRFILTEPGIGYRLKG